MLNIKPQDVHGYVMNVKVVIDLPNVFFIIVVPPTLMVPKAEHLEAGVTFYWLQIIITTELADTFYLRFQTHSIYASSFNKIYKEGMIIKTKVK